jgi:hypothetical protein
MQSKALSADWSARMLDRMYFRNQTLFLRFLPVVALLLAVAAGCSPPSASNRSRRTGWETERPGTLDARTAVVPAVPDEDVLDLVRDHPAPDGRGLTREWVERVVDVRAQALFPRWQVARRGATRYEVKYTYTLIDATNQITRVGYTWGVDAALKVVDDPQTMTVAEPAATPDRRFNLQQRRRIEEEEASLE